MSVIENRANPTLESLAQAVTAWTGSGDERKLARWLARELDADGVPIRLTVADWSRCLEMLGGARRLRGAWPASCGSAIDALVLTVLRFSRPDGHPILGWTDTESPVWSSPDWRRWYRGTGVGRVLDWWGGGRARRLEPVPPPLPTWSSAGRVLGMFRPDWSSGGDFLAVDHRDVGTSCGFELQGSGRTWLGPEWGEVIAPAGEPKSRPRPSQVISGATADLIEWAYRADDLRVTRSAVLLRGLGMALLSITIEGRGMIGEAHPALRLSMPPGVAARPIRDSRALALSTTGRRGSAQALPIALPCRPYPTERGSLRADERELILAQAPAGRRCWLPLLVSWNADRLRKPPSWRVLTVSEKSRPVAPDRAFAVRVSWGRDETFVIYRSLGPPARRAFLGHQTTARFLIADFDQDGDLKPILSVE